MATDWQPSTTTAGSKWRAEYPRFPTTATVKRLFGSREAALRAAGHEPRPRQWTRETIIDALRRDAQARGRPPRYREWQGNTSDSHPDASTTAAYFGTWHNALVAVAYVAADGSCRGSVPGVLRKARLLLAQPQSSGLA
jgi:hypothetical protein